MSISVPDRTISIVQGEYRASTDPSEVLSTVLGSCIAVCLHDPVMKVGGMNHFLLPGSQEHDGENSERYGLFAMEMLINALLKLGAKKASLQAKIFGGAKMMTDLREIGKSNSIFAKDFLRAEGIACIAESVGGTNARRVIYRPATGQARMLSVPSSDVLPPVKAVLRPKDGGTNAIELF